MEGSGGPGTPTESLLSLCSHPSFGSVWSGYSFTARSFLPDKLQIVKPLEGDYSSNPPYHKKQNQNQTASSNENDISPKPRQHQIKPNINLIFQHAPLNQGCQTQVQNQSQNIQNQQDNQFVIFHDHSQHKIFISASHNPKTMQRSSSVMELSSLPSSQSHLSVPLASVTRLLEVLEQQEGSLNLQHSFYFRHTQPRCWFEL